MAKKKPVAEALYFTIEGLWLSEFARTRVSEGAWGRALKMLVKDVNCTHEQAIKILMGEANFTGEAQIGNPNCPGLGWEDLPKDGKVAKEMRKRLDYMYGSTFCYRDEYWKPYAYVRGWGVEDYDFSRKHEGTFTVIGAGPGREDRRSYLRSLYYANDVQKDMLVVIGTDKFNTCDVLCEKAVMPPTWYDVSVNEPTKHLWDLHQNGKLILPLRSAFEGHEDIKHVPPDSFVAQEEEETRRAEQPEEEVAKESVQLTKDFLEAINNAKDSAELGKIEREFEAKFDKLRQGSIPMEVWDEKTKAHEAVQEAREKYMGDRVREQADKMGGWMTLKLKNKDGSPFTPSSIKVPKNPFLLWALRGFRFEDYDKESPEWKMIAGMGWKMQMDDPYHTDWMLGAGIPLSETYDRAYGEEKVLSLGAAVRNASFAVRSKIVSDWTGVKFVILAKGDDQWVGGEIVHPKPNEGCPPGSIAVVPHAGPEYQLAMETACKKGGQYDRPGLVICETGGKLAHLAIVGNEMKCTVIMVPGALKKYKPGRSIYVNMREMEITEHI